MRKIVSYASLVLPVVIIAHLVILTNIRFFPYPELFVYPYLTSKGLLPYKQIFDQHFPGLMFFPINLYTLGMTTPQAARVWHLSTISITHLLIYLVAKKVLKLGKWSVVCNLVYLFWQPYLEGYVLWIDTFIPILLLPAYFLLARAQSRAKDSLFWPGLLLGLALVFKQVVGPIIALVFIYLIFKKIDLRRLVVFALGVFLPVFVMLVYIASIGAVKEFYFWTITFNLGTFNQMGRKLPTAGGLVKAGLVFGPPILFMLYEIFWKKKGELTLLFLFFISAFIFAYARYDFIHLQPALAFAVLIYGLGFAKFDKSAFLGMPYFLVLLYALLVPFYKISSTASVFFYGTLEERMAEVVTKYADEGDSVFALATTPHLYVFTKTLPPGRVFIFHFPWFMVEAESEILRGLNSDNPKVILRDKDAAVQGLNLVSYVPHINDYIEQNYKIVDKIDGVEVLIPK